MSHENPTTERKSGSPKRRSGELDIASSGVATGRSRLAISPCLSCRYKTWKGLI